MDQSLQCFGLSRKTLVKLSKIANYYKFHAGQLIVDVGAVENHFIGNEEKRKP
jgi:hypothetical protein